MAGRGRGRGRGVSFNVESLGFGRGEALPGPILQPPPAFPALEHRPVPLAVSEEYDYLLALKQEFYGQMMESPYHLNPGEKKTDIERYSDKYQIGQHDNQWQPNWEFLPKELKLKVKKIRRNRSEVKAVLKPKIPTSRPASQINTDVQATLQELEKKEEQMNEKKDGENAEEEEGEGEEEYEEEYYDEEEMEEGTDYIMSYFDNGENYQYDEDDDLDNDGPVY